jgi:uncharacterized membrane protein
LALDMSHTLTSTQTDTAASGQAAGAALGEANPAHAEPVPYFPPPPVGPRALFRPLGFSSPLQWLTRGWADFRAHPGIGLFYGLCFWAMAVVLAGVFQTKPEYTMSIASGCLLVGPFLALGLYEVSRRRERGEPVRLVDSLLAWRGHVKSMGMLVLVFMVLELLWGRASLVVFAVFFNTGLPSTAGVIEAVFNPENLEFVLVYLAVGSVFALLVFATSVVSIPMILDRDTDAITAAIQSIRVFYEHPGVLLFWGALIAVLVFVSLLPLGAGLVLTGPLLGHATWHAYRDVIEWQEAEEGAAR